MDDSYVAGLFDGEGTVGVYAVKANGQGSACGGDWWTVKMALTGAYKPMIEAVHAYMGVGSFSYQKRQDIERTPRADYSPRADRPEGVRLSKQSWRWVVSSRVEVALVLQRLLPNLIEKRKQADVILAFVGGLISGQEAHDSCIRLKKESFPMTGFVEPLRRSTGSPGCKNPNASLSDAQVVAIREGSAKGKDASELSSSLGVSYGVVYNVITNRTYKNV